MAGHMRLSPQQGPTSSGQGIIAARLFLSRSPTIQWYRQPLSRLNPKSKGLSSATCPLPRVTVNELLLELDWDPPTIKSSLIQPLKCLPSTLLCVGETEVRGVAAQTTQPGI